MDSQFSSAQTEVEILKAARQHETTFDLLQHRHTSLIGTSHVHVHLFIVHVDVAVDILLQQLYFPIPGNLIHAINQQ